MDPYERYHRMVSSSPRLSNDKSYSEFRVIKPMSDYSIKPKDKKKWEEYRKSKRFGKGLRKSFGKHKRLSKRKIKKLRKLVKKLSKIL